MKANEIREMTIDELKDRLLELKKDFFSIRLKKSTGQLENNMKIKALKRDIARINTIIREKELGIDKKIKVTR